MAPNKEVTEIDFLANYYTQDGDFGAPQGGIGTEALDNVAGLVVVRVPLDSNTAIDWSVGGDYYSSASTDRIDYQTSTASSSDLRAYGNVAVEERDLRRGRTYTAGVGLSREYDYESLSLGVGVAQEWGRGTHELSVGLRAFLDRWDLIYPVEFRRPNSGLVPLDGRGRQSYGLALTYSRVVNRRVQLALALEPVAMRGTLSTPFHRVFFARPGAPDFAELYLSTPLEQRDRVVFAADDIERLPATRLKLPVSLRLNAKVNDVLSLRTFARYYADSWAVRGVSGEIELAYQYSEAWALLPSVRYYDQSASEYYAGFARHDPAAEFYTSDFDLAAFSTAKFGLGVRYAPVFGVARAMLGGRGLEWQQINLRGAYYRRDPGLTALTFTAGVKLGLRRRGGSR